MVVPVSGVMAVHVVLATSRARQPQAWSLDMRGGPCPACALPPVARLSSPCSRDRRSRASHFGSPRPLKAAGARLEPIPQE